MEDTKKIQENQSTGTHQDGNAEWPDGGDDVQAFKKIWRRVFNKRIDCYEIYVGNSNYLVATGITDKSDSFLVGTIPLMIKLLHNFCRETVKGEIDIKTYEEARNLIKEWRSQQPRPTRTGKKQGKGMGRIDLQQLNSPDNELEKSGGGSYSDAEFLPAS
jgi:hypothetical protein